MRVLVQLGGLGEGLLPDPLARRLNRRGECVWGGRGVVVLLLVDGNVEPLHAGVEGVGPHRYGHRLTGVDKSSRFALLLVLHRHHVDLLFVVIFVVVIV